MTAPTPPVKPPAKKKPMKMTGKQMVGNGMPKKIGVADLMERC